jgi:hypothetical protein
VDQAGILFHDGSPALKLEEPPHGQPQPTDGTEALTALPEPGDMAADVLALVYLPPPNDAQLSVLVLAPPGFAAEPQVFQGVGRLLPLTELLLDGGKEVGFQGPGGLPVATPEPGQGGNLGSRNTGWKFLIIGCLGESAI